MKLFDKERRKTVKILSIDGGGIRGALAAKFLECLEEDLLKHTGKTIYETFDILAGTSSGGILASYIAGHKARGMDCVKLYSASRGRLIMNKTIWDEIAGLRFKPKYDGKGKHRLLTSVFKDKRLFDVAKDKTLIVTSYDVERRKEVIFKNKQSSRHSLYNPTLVEICDATSAAPTYFPTIKSTDNPPRWLVDGGLAANNPALIALVDAMGSRHSIDNIRLLSIGTGKEIRSKVKQIGEESIHWGQVQWISNFVIEHFMAGNSATVNYYCRKILDKNYLRADIELTGGANDEPDDVTRANVRALNELGEQLYKNIGEQTLELLK